MDDGGYFLRYLKPFYPAWDDVLAQELVQQFDLPWIVSFGICRAA